MRLVRNVLRALVAVLALGAYLWYGGARALPRVKRRKLRRRQARGEA